MNTQTQKSHTTNEALVAGKIAREPELGLRPEDLPLDEDARGVWTAVTGDEGILQHPALAPVRTVLHRLRKESDRSCMLVAAGKIMVRLAAAKVPEWRLRLIPLYLERVIEACFAGKAQRHIDAIDRDEQQFESRETQLTLDRRIAEANGQEVPAEALLEEATINECEAAIQLERARNLRRRAARQAFKRPLQRVAAS